MNNGYQVRRAKAGRHHIAVHEMGSGDPVVLVHGLMGSAETWRGVAEGVASAGCRAVMPELLGFGHSDRTTDIECLWLDSQADALLAALAPQLPRGAVFVGHDYGGPTVVTLHRRAPELVRGMVLMSCNLTTDTPVPFPLSAWSWPLVGGLMRRAVLSRLSMGATVRMAARRPLRAPIARYLGDAREFAAMQAIFTHAILELADRYREVHEALDSIRVPVRLLWGDSDPFFPLAEGRRMAAAIPGAGFGVLRECGHFAPEECPAEVIAAIQEVVAAAQCAGRAA